MLANYSDLLNIILLMLATGIVGGILAGLLGVGGGIVIVPVLDLALGLTGADPASRMHVAVATSLSTIIPTSISSARAHFARGAVDVALSKRWAAAIFIGAAVGVILASQVTSSMLSTIFAVVALIVAVKMILPLENRFLHQNVPITPFAQFIPLTIGMFSSMMGIGGGTLTVPILTLFNQSIHRAVATSAFFGLLISIPATIGFIVSGWKVPDLPQGSFGYVNIFGLLIIAPMSYIFAPLGAKIAHLLSRRQLSVAFALFLFLVAIRMVVRSFSS